MFFSRMFFTIALLGCSLLMGMNGVERSLSIELIEVIASRRRLEGLQQLLKTLPGTEKVICRLLDERRERGNIGVHMPTEVALYDFHEQLCTLPKEQ